MRTLIRSISDTSYDCYIFPCTEEREHMCNDHHMAINNNHYWLDLETNHDMFIETDQTVSMVPECLLFSATNQMEFEKNRNRSRAIFILFLFKIDIPGPQTSLLRDFIKFAYS